MRRALRSVPVFVPAWGVWGVFLGAVAGTHPADDAHSMGIERAQYNG